MFYNYYVFASIRIRLHLLNMDWNLRSVHLKNWKVYVHRIDVRQVKMLH